MTPDFVTAETVAAMLGLRDGRAFLRQRDALEQGHAFPTPMPGCARPMRWRADAVAAWVAANGMPMGSAAPLRGPSARLMQEART